MRAILRAGGISDQAKAAWDRWQVLEDALKKNLEERDRLLVERDKAYAEMAGLGRQEGWHA